MGPGGMAVEERYDRDREGKRGFFGVRKKEKVKVVRSGGLQYSGDAWTRVGARPGASPGNQDKGGAREREREGKCVLM